ncbi:MAG: LPS assembly protein LptD [Sulfurimonas sp.]|nr:LPS assembly protein LptD [Sulfurimonas sp.]
MYKLLILFFLSFVAYAESLKEDLASDKVEIFATTIQTEDNIITASGDVAVVYKDYYLTASKAVYNKESGDLELFDNVRANQNSEYKTLGNYAKLNIKNKQRSFEPFYMLEEISQTWISADKGSFKDRDLDLSSGVVSSCDPQNPLWKMEFSSSDYNLDDKWLNLYNTRIYIYDIPVFYTPWFGYPLDKTRRTGLLVPTMGYSQDEGFYYQQPIYIAEYDEWDLELNPQLRTDRGFGLYSTFRFVDSPASRGDFTVGYFKEKDSYFDSVNLKNQEHYGFKFDYQHNDVLNDYLDINLDGQSGLYVDIGYMNDVDYINLESNDFINTSTATQIASRVNLFYNNEDNYYGMYLKHYQDLTLDTNEATIQQLPTLHYHHYLETMFEDHLNYNLDIQSKNIYRQIDTKVTQTDINIPVSLSTHIFDEYIDLSFKTNLYGQQSSFTGNETRNLGTREYKDGYVLKNDNLVSVSTQLTKSYTDFSHVIAFGANYIFDGGETSDGFYEDNREFCKNVLNANEPICEFYNITDVEKEFQFDFSQYIYDVDGKQIVYHRLVQNILTQGTTTLGDLENELNYMISNEINFYNNMFYNHENKKLSKAYNKISYRDYGFDVSLSHLYKDTFLQAADKTSYMTSAISYQYNSHYRYFFSYDYDIELDVKKRAEIGFLYSKRCWDFGIRYAQNNRPELGRNGQIVNAYDKYIYFTIAFKPFMSSAGNSLFAFKLPDKENTN